jgi:hypothetical protein
MRPRLSRVRNAEWSIAIASIALVAVLFGAPWYTIWTNHGSAVGVAPPAQNGWHSLPVLGPFVLVVGALGLAVWWLQATRAAPALPVCATVVLAVLSFAALICLVYRVLIDPPADARGDVWYGAWCGVVLSGAMLSGAFRSLRDDGISPRDAPAEIETISLAELAGRGSPAPEP